MRKFLTYSTLNSFLIAVEYSMSTQAMFLNNQLAATSYLLKDVVGQLGATSAMYISAKYVDKHRFTVLNASQALYQTTLLIDSTLPTLHDSNMFIGALTLSSCMKTIAWTMHGTLNIATINKLSKTNSGELYTKLSAVNCVGNVGGIFCGLMIGQYIQPSSYIGLYGLTGITRYAVNRKLFERVIKDGK